MIHVIFFEIPNERSSQLESDLREVGSKIITHRHNDLSGFFHTLAYLTLLALQSPKPLPILLIVPQDSNLIRLIHDPKRFPEVVILVYDESIDSLAGKRDGATATFDFINHKQLAVEIHRRLKDPE